MQWTDQEPDAADLGNIVAQRDWFNDRLVEVERVGKGVQTLVDGIGSQWQGETSTAWKTKVNTILDVLLSCRKAYRLGHDGLNTLHESLTGLRTIMDEVRRTEASWGYTLQENQVLAGTRGDWLTTNSAIDNGVDWLLVGSMRDLLAEAQAMVATAEKMLSEAQIRREECAAKRRIADADAISSLNSAVATLPKEFPPGISNGESVISDTFGLSLIRASLVGLSNQQLKDFFAKDSSGKLAALLTGALPKPGDKVEGIDPALITVLAGLAIAPATLDRRGQLSKIFSSLTPEQAIKLAYLFPGLGNIDGVPFKARYAGNEVNIAGAIPARRDQQSGLDKAVKDAQSKVEELQKKYDDWARTPAANSGYIPPYLDLEKAKQDLAAAEKATRFNADLIKNYRRYLTENTPTYRILSDGGPVLNSDGTPETQVGHQILIFSDTGPGAVAEVWGDPETARQVGIAVPGTKTNMVGFPGTSSDQAKSFMDRALSYTEDGGVWAGAAMISWAGGEFPQNIPLMDGGLTPEKSAGDTSYAMELGARLNRFGDAVSAAAPGAEVSVGGHSYGGSVVGQAQSLGMKVDRVLYIESAGMGPGVGSIYDFPNAATTKYYQMTAPGDPIWTSQRSGIHGADPNLDPGVRTLETGFVDNDQRPGGTVLSGQDSHSGVFRTTSTAWKSMYGFYTDTPMEAKAPYDVALKQPSYQPQMIDPVTDKPYAVDHSRQDWSKELISKYPPPRVVR